MNVNATENKLSQYQPVAFDLLIFHSLMPSLVLCKSVYCLFYT